MATRNYLLEEMAKSRSRSSWNDRLVHWERPASETEEAQIERAAAMVRGALEASAWLNAENVVVEPQGSYFNNTNVRQTADQDLRAVHPALRVEYAPGVERQAAERQLGIYSVARTYAEILAPMRSEIDSALAQRFGALNLDVSGSKATRVLALPGSRAPVDVVPCFRYIWVTADGLGQLSEHHGVTIISKAGVWTNNFPAQRNTNGIAKRARTLHRFKKVVRSLKRLREELVDAKLIAPKQAPSFLIESLVYAVEDSHFTATSADERYDRLLQVVERMEALLADPQWVQNATEINEIKYLFRPAQAWTIEGVQSFAQAARMRLLGL